MSITFRLQKWHLICAYDTNLIRAMLQANLCILYLEFLNNLQGGESMNTDKLTLSDDLKEYMVKRLNTVEQETAMFLLGYMIAECGKVPNIKKKLA